MGADVFDSSHKTYIYPVTDVVRCSLKKNYIFGYTENKRRYNNITRFLPNENLSKNKSKTHNKKE